MKEFWSLVQPFVVFCIVTVILVMACTGASNRNKLKYCLELGGPFKECHSIVYGDKVPCEREDL